MKGPSSRWSRASFFLLAAGVFLFDQASKRWITETLGPGENRSVIPGLFNLTHWRNRGAAFGLFADANSSWIVVLLVVVSLVVLGLVLRLLWRGLAPGWTGVGLGLILGGALGNLYDRLQAGSVVDFLDFHLGGYHWPAFNLADSAIVIGAALLLAVSLRRPQRTLGEKKA